jgi:hypothetical protein
MPFRTDRKEKRSYLDKGPTKEQLESRDILRERLFSDDGDDSDEFYMAVRRRSRSETRGPVVEKNRIGKKEKRRSRSTAGLAEMRNSLMSRVSGGFNYTPPPSPPKPSSKKPGNTLSKSPNRERKKKKKKAREREMPERRRSRSETRGPVVEKNIIGKKEKRRPRSTTGLTEIRKSLMGRVSGGFNYTPPPSPPKPSSKKPGNTLSKSPNRERKKEKKKALTGEAPERRRSRSETRGPLVSNAERLKSRSSSLTKLGKGVMRRLSGGKTPPVSPKPPINKDVILSNALKRVQERKKKKDEEIEHPRRRSRSFSSEQPATPKRKKRRSRSTTGLTEMRKSLLRRANGLKFTPPPSPKPGKSPDDVRSTALSRVQQRRNTRIIEREYLMDTIMMEDDGGVCLDYPDDESADATSSAEAKPSNIFYRGLQALEKLYLE